MTPASARTVSLVPPGQRPRDDELDMFGLTHPGKVRKENQDHFLLATVHPEIVVHGTSLPNADTLPLRGGRLGTILLVADGVGGSDDGESAARLATEAVARYVASSLHCYHAIGAAKEDEFLDKLEEAAMQAHDAVRQEAGTRRMATTMTLGIGVWPWLYAVQVGDSRMYIYTHGRLTQVTRDQTVGQDLVDEGAMTKSDLRRSPLAHVLSSAIGADEARPVVTRVDISERGGVGIICSDGLTKHVTDGEIEAFCRNVQTAEKLARDLLQLALERGGTDNVTIIVARAPLRGPSPEAR